MTKLTFYGAVNEIGGNKILLEDNGTKLFLDFGMSLARLTSIFQSFCSQENAVDWAISSSLGFFLTCRASTVLTSLNIWGDQKKT